MKAQPQITDRAHRYRANKILPVEGQACLFCGSTCLLVPDHWDGHPDHTTRDNLEVLCTSCNIAKGKAFVNANRGRRAHQYNPTSGGGAANVGEWLQAVGAITPHRGAQYAGSNYGLTSTMSTQAAVDMIRATPQSKRRAFAAKLARKNPFWSAPDARQTTPAHGGIAYHQSKRKPAATGKRAKETKAESESFFSVPDEETLQKGFSKGQSLADMLRGNPGLRKLRTANPAAFDRGVKSIRKRGGRTNPASESADVFEEFHGFPSAEVITVKKKVHHHAHLAALGELVELDVWGVDGAGHQVTGFGGAVLATNEDKTQLFIEGGDQALNLREWGIRKPHEMETIGQLVGISYFTDKTHLGDEGGEAVYVHKMRTTNDNGKHVTVKIATYPDLIYDVRNEQLLISGGSYEILREGINK